MDGSMVIGESLHILKEINAYVIGGTINFHGVLHIHATKVGSDTILSMQVFNNSVSIFMHCLHRIT